MKILGREPAVFFSLVAGLLLALIQLVGVNDPAAGALNAVVLAGAGFATAAFVSVDRALPALIGLVQAVFAVFLAYGSPVDENTQTGILALIAAGAAFFVRSNVVAKVRPDVEPWQNQLDAAYDRGHNEGYDAGYGEVSSTAPASGQHADGPDFRGEVTR